MYVLCSVLSSGSSANLSTGIYFQRPDVLVSAQQNTCYKETCGTLKDLITKRQAYNQALRKSQPAVTTDHKISISMYELGDVDLKNLLIIAAKEGINIQIVINDFGVTKRGAQDRTAAQFRIVDALLVESNIQIKVLGKPYDGSTVSNMHHKMIVCSWKETSAGKTSGTLIVGSYNWTKNAKEKNYEDCIVLQTDDLHSTISGDTISPTVKKAADENVALFTSSAARAFPPQPKPVTRQSTPAPLSVSGPVTDQLKQLQQMTSPKAPGSTPWKPAGGQH